MDPNVPKSPDAAVLPAPSPVARSGRKDSQQTRPLQPLAEINERCIELLARDARAARAGRFPLITQLGGTLLAMDAEARKRAARRSLLLVDLEFGNAPWWQTLLASPSRPAPLPPWRGTFPKAPAVHLARATLTVAWHSLRSDPHTACPLGIAPAVAGLIAALALADIERIAERRFRYLRPRWEDRPAVWRHLLHAAHTRDARKAREFNVRGLQLLIGDLL